MARAEIRKERQMNYSLKSISREGIPEALDKAERYRLLKEPGEAESICRDVLTVDPDTQAALRTVTPRPRASSATSRILTRSSITRASFTNDGPRHCCEPAPAPIPSSSS